MMELRSMMERGASAAFGLRGAAVTNVLMPVLESGGAESVGLYWAVPRDRRDIRCPGGRLKARQKDWLLLDGVYDRRTTAALFEWIVARREMPFFAVLWTMQTHYPYFAAEDRPFAPGAPRINRYMLGLHESDQAVGDLLKRLDAAGVLDSTLWWSSATTAWDSASTGIPSTRPCTKRTFTFR
jgi:hypothetical protein